MNFNYEDEFNLAEGIRSIERKICRFYESVMKDYYYLDLNFSSNYTRSPYRRKQTREQKKLFLLCIQDTCLGLRKFYASVAEYKEIAKYLSKKTPIKIYCIQGESLLSALGICIVIDEAFKKYRFTDKAEMKQIQLVVTEKDQNWRSLCSYIVERVNSCYKNVDITLELICERSDRLSNELFRNLREADIVVIARYFSQFHYLRIKTHFLEVILQRMKELSILFYLDTYDKIYEDTLKQLFSKLDSLIEIRSKKAVYTPLRNTRNKKYFLEFPFLFTTAFEDVMYSTCVKYSGINYNSFVKKDLKNELSLLRYSKREMKLMISERFEKENSFPSPLKNTLDANTFQSETLIMLRKLLSTLMGKSNRKTKHARKNSMVILNESDYANYSLSRLQILTSSVNSKKRATEHSKNGNAFKLSLRNKANLNSVSRGADIPNTGAFKASKIIEKLISINLQNNNKKFETEKRWNAETIRTSICSGKVVTANAHNKRKYSEENKRNAKIARSTKFVEKLPSANLYNENKYRCPYLCTKERVTIYSYYLAEIYYSKHCDRKKPSARKFKSFRHLKRIACRNLQKTL